MWVRDCFWHALFAFILLMIMWIWRPSSTRRRVAYSLVADKEEEEEEEEVVFELTSNRNSQYGCNELALHCVILHC